MTVSRLLPFAILAAALAAPALAADPEAVATAPAGGAPPTVAQQIDEYLKTSPALALPTEAAAGVAPGAEPRKVHGMLDVSAGTGGYRSAYAASEIPLGKTGTATIAVGETHVGDRGGRFHPYGGQSLGLGLSFDADPNDCRRLQAREAGPPDLSLDPRIEGGRRRACPAAAPGAPR